MAGKGRKKQAEEGPSEEEGKKVVMESCQGRRADRLVKVGPVVGWEAAMDEGTAGRAVG